jgi:hypothetical protein
MAGRFFLYSLTCVNVWPGWDWHSLSFKHHECGGTTTFKKTLNHHYVLLSM